MKKRLISIIAVVLLFACSIEQNDSLFQISTIDALLAGNYKGYYSCNNLLEHGDFGLGTFNQLDGEMIVLDGTIYQVKGDGSILKPDLETTTPFCAVKFFSVDTTLKMKGVRYEEMKHQLDQVFPDHSRFYAFRIEGSFATIKTRSLYAQQPPYRDLVDIPMQKFNASDIEGTLLGFRCPKFVKGLNVPGYHLHFLSHDHSFGGHVLDFKMKQGTIMADKSSEFQMLLPDDEGEFSKVENKDRSGELEKVEK